MKEYMWNGCFEIFVPWRDREFGVNADMLFHGERQRESTLAAFLSGG